MSQKASFSPETAELILKVLELAKRLWRGCWGFAQVFQLSCDLISSSFPILLPDALVTGHWSLVTGH